MLPAVVRRLDEEGVAIAELTLRNASLNEVFLSDVFVPDDAFEDLGYIAYRIDGTTLLGTIGLNYPLGARDSVDLSWRRVEGKAKRQLSFEGGALRYIDNQYSLMYLMRF